MSVFPDGLEPADDLTPARWVEAILQDRMDRPLRVRDLIPPMFDAYARILHQPRTADEGQPSSGAWSRRAVELGYGFDPTASWWDVIGTPPFGAESGDPMPEIGSLTKHEVESLASVLDASDGQDACWFGIWSGWGFLSPRGHAELRPRRSWFSELRERRRGERQPRRSAERMSPQMRVIGEPCFLIRGTVNDAARFTFDGWFQSPTLWWPDDRTWFVHTHIDAMSSYLGGPRDAVDRLTAEQVFEVFEVEAGDMAGL
jgi:hypothetical protein